MKKSKNKNSDFKKKSPMKNIYIGAFILIVLVLASAILNNYISKNAEISETQDDSLNSLPPAPYIIGTETTSISPNPTQSQTPGPTTSPTTNPTATPVPPCVPKTCAQIGKECGTWNDHCGNRIICARCPSNKPNCVLGICKPDPNQCNTDSQCLDPDEKPGVPHAPGDYPGIDVGVGDYYCGIKNGLQPDTLCHYIKTVHCNTETIYSPNTCNIGYKEICPPCGFNEYCDEGSDGKAACLPDPKCAGKECGPRSGSNPGLLECGKCTVLCKTNCISGHCENNKIGTYSPITEPACYEDGCQCDGAGLCVAKLKPSLVPNAEYPCSKPCWKKGSHTDQCGDVCIPIPSYEKDKRCTDQGKTCNYKGECE